MGFPLLQDRMPGAGVWAAARQRSRRDNSFLKGSLVSLWERQFSEQESTFTCPSSQPGAEGSTVSYSPGPESTMVLSAALRWPQPRGDSTRARGISNLESQPDWASHSSLQRSLSSSHHSPNTVVPPHQAMDWGVWRRGEETDTTTSQRQRPSFSTSASLAKLLLINAIGLVQDFSRFEMDFFLPQSSKGRKGNNQRIR